MKEFFQLKQRLSGADLIMRQIKRLKGTKLGNSINGLELVIFEIKVMNFGGSLTKYDTDMRDFIIL